MQYKKCTSNSYYVTERIPLPALMAEFDSYPRVDRTPIEHAAIYIVPTDGTDPSDVIFDLLSYSGSTLGGARVARVGPDQSRAKDGDLRKKLKK
jgi:hypothetical protein